MNATQLLEELQQRAVVLWVEGSGEAAGLAYEAPPGVLTSRLLSAMKASKRELLLLLAEPAKPAKPLAQVLAPSTDRASERRRVLAAFPTARPRTSGVWRLGSRLYSHAGLLADADALLAVLLAERGDLAEGTGLDELAAIIRREAQAQREAERARIASVFPEAVMLANGLLRIDAQDYDHDGALALAAWKVGTTTNGHAIEADVGELYRAAQAESGAPASTCAQAPRPRAARAGAVERARPPTASAADLARDHALDERLAA